MLGVISIHKIIDNYYIYMGLEVIAKEQWVEKNDKTVNR